MKKLILVLVAFCFILCFNVTVFADEQEGEIETSYVTKEEVSTYSNPGPGESECTLVQGTKFHLEDDMCFGGWKCANVRGTICYITDQDFSEKCEEVKNEYSHIFANMTDEEMLELCQVMYLEGHNQDTAARIANVEVVMNRVNSPEWPNSVHDVLSQRGQFSTWKSSKNVIEGQPYKWRGDNCVSFDNEREAIEYVRENGSTQLGSDYVYFATHKVNGHDFIKIDSHYYSR